MAHPDLLLLHPPSVWDFRTRPRLAGPVSDLVPSSPVFEMYPIGFVTIADYLGRNGYEVRIANLAVRMLKSDGFDPSRFMARQDPKVIGVGLHWLPHAHGALEAARIAKEHHPDTPVILGGLSATYFHREIIERYPFVDMVMRGDSTERPLVRLLRAVEGGGDLSKVPNLSWRGADGKVIVNEELDVPEDLDHLSYDYDVVVRSIMKYRDLTGHMPTPDWRRYPVTAMMTVRGCTQECVTCGGSGCAYKRAFGRDRPTYRSPEAIVKDMAHLSSILDGPIFLVCDIRQAGKGYAERLLDGLKRERIGNEVVVELFWPASRDLLGRISGSIERWNLSLSPDSHDPVVREALGRHYDNASIERCISGAFELGCNRFDLYFMIGLPRQDPDSPLASVEFCDRLMRENKGRPLRCYISPQAPFLDPGSRAFEEPAAHGYRLRARTLEEHRRLLTMPSWKHALNYETEWMSADVIMLSTYSAAAAMNDSKLDNGLVDQGEHDRIHAGIEVSLVAMREIDGIMGLDDEDERQARLGRLRDDLDTVGRDILAGKGEMEWPTKGIKYYGVLRSLLKKRPS